MRHGLRHGLRHGKAVRARGLQAGHQVPACQRAHPGPAQTYPQSPPHNPVCAPGYGASLTGLCQQCAAGTFSAGGNSTSKRPACASCPAGFTSTVTGATSASSCTGGERLADTPAGGRGAITVWGWAWFAVRAAWEDRGFVRTLAAAARAPATRQRPCDVRARARCFGCGLRRAPGMRARHACGHPARRKVTARQIVRRPTPQTIASERHHPQLQCSACLLRTADVNECVVLSQPCFDANSVCNNTAGSYNCTCAVGYTVASGDAKTTACDGECERGVRTI